MRAGLRLGFVVWAAAFALAPATALAQDATQASQPPSSSPPPVDTVGPEELLNFNLQGNVTRPAEAAPASRRPTPPPPVAQGGARTIPPASSPPAATPNSREAGRAVAAAPPPAARAVERRTEPLRQTPPAASVTVALPRLDNGTVRSSAAAPVPAPVAAAGSTAALAPERKLSLFPWLLAALALGAGAALLFYRHRHSREALADGPQFDMFVAPEPATEADRTGPQPITGMVSTRLRPWIEIGFQPARCLVEEHQVTFEFELELLNSGSAAARGVLIEASLFNASNGQEQELGQFFANPVAEGERIPSIQPLKKVKMTTKVTTAREHVQVYEISGRKVFVPVIAFNALYRWSGGEGQSSASYLLGIDTKRDKMAPFRLDLGPRLFPAVTARQLSTGVRS